MLYIRSRDRRTGYTAFVFSQLSVELGDNLSEVLNLAALKKFDVDREVEAFQSIEFQKLLNQEHNLALFRRLISNSPSKRLVKELEKYMQQLGGSI